MKLVNTIAVANIPGRIDHFSLDLKPNATYMAVVGANTVVAINLSQGKELGPRYRLEGTAGRIVLP